MPKRILKGKIVSKTEKTIIVEVERIVTDPKYGKIRKSHKKYAAHNPYNQFNLGDEISIVESRPFSKTKFFEVVEQDKI